jgi:hypothetical protein
LAGSAAAPYGGWMANDPQIELRVSRLENDRDSIYDLISEIWSTQQEHSRRFDSVDRRFDSVDRRFDSIEATLTEVVRRLPEPS